MYLHVFEFFFDNQLWKISFQSYTVKQGCVSIQNNQLDTF